jgi:hypothetical protein
MKVTYTKLFMPLSVLAAGMLTNSGGLRAAEGPDFEQISKLLSQAKTDAYQLREDTATNGVVFSLEQRLGRRKELP